MATRSGKALAMGGIIALLSVLISLIPLSRVSFADGKTHYAAARELVGMTYDEKILYESARSAGLAEVEHKYESNPRPKIIVQF